LDEEAMRQAAPLIEGERDFTSFAAVDAEKILDPEGPPSTWVRVPSAIRSNVRTVFSSQWQRKGDELIYEVRGNGFLHHMVRNLVGTFLLVGKGPLRPSDVITILEAKNRSAAGATAPASGLYLVGVEYPVLESTRMDENGG
jgi:tRNA pseudouridine38-40 synthase